MTNPLKPNFTQIPNYILDNLFEYTQAEVACLMVICRQTYGWHKDSDKISISQFVSKTSMSKPTILKAIKNLEKKGVIRRESAKARTIAEYSILVKNFDQEASKESLPPSKETLPDQTETGKETLHTKETIKEMGVQNKTGESPEVTEALKHWSKLTNQLNGFSKSQRKDLQTTINQYGLPRVKIAMTEMCADPWTIENNAFSLNRLVKLDKRSANMAKFAKAREFTYQELKGEERAEYFEILNNEHNLPPGALNKFLEKAKQRRIEKGEIWQ